MKDDVYSSFLTSDIFQTITKVKIARAMTMVRPKILYLMVEPSSHPYGVLSISANRDALGSNCFEALN
jgi:hypothetical protein